MPSTMRTSKIHKATAFVEGCTRIRESSDLSTWTTSVGRREGARWCSNLDNGVDSGPV